MTLQQHKQGVMCVSIPILHSDPQQRAFTTALIVVVRKDPAAQFSWPGGQQGSVAVLIADHLTTNTYRVQLSSAR